MTLIISEDTIPSQTVHKNVKGIQNGCWIRVDIKLFLISNLVGMIRKNAKIILPSNLNAHCTRSSTNQLMFAAKTVVQRYSLNKLPFLMFGTNAINQD